MAEINLIAGPPHGGKTTYAREHHQSGESDGKAARGSRVFRKTFAADVKATESDDGSTTFEGYAAVFGNIDLGGDKIIKGAFAETLQKRYPNDGAGIPVYWNHNTDDPFANIGMTAKAIEDDHGLKVTVLVDTSTDYGKQVAKLLKEGRVTQMSFAFDVKDGAFVDSEDDGSFYELRKLDLFEVSVVPIGMNQETEITSVKAVKEQEREKAPEPDEKDSGEQTVAHLETAARRLRAMDL